MASNITNGARWGGSNTVIIRIKFVAHHKKIAMNFWDFRLKVLENKFLFWLSFPVNDPELSSTTRWLTSNVIPIRSRNVQYFAIVLLVRPTWDQIACMWTLNWDEFDTPALLPKSLSILNCLYYYFLTSCCVFDVHLWRMIRFLWPPSQHF